MLVTGLAQTPGLDVVSSERIDEILGDLGGATLETLDRSQVLEVGRRAGAGALIAGNVFAAGGTFRIDARVQEVATGCVVSAYSVTGPDVFPLVDELTGRIRNSLQMAADSAARSVAEVTSSNLEAYRLYTDGVEAFRNIRLADARRLLEQAVRLDPSFGGAIQYLAVIAERLGDAAAADEYRRQVADHLDRLPVRQRLVAEADAARRAGQYGRAAELLETLAGLKASYYFSASAS